MSNTGIGARMKDYEACFTFSLPRCMPLIVRVDGRVFHSLTADMQTSFDSRFCDAMVHPELSR